MMKSPVVYFLSNTQIASCVLVASLCCLSWPMTVLDQNGLPKRLHLIMTKMVSGRI